MNHREILKKHMWDRVDVDKAYWYQCIDWVRMYSLYRARNITTRWNAIDLWNKWLGKDWKKIVKTPFNYPSEGDVVFFWGTTYGHVWIGNRFCNPLLLRMTDQNWWDGSGNWIWNNAIKARFRNYKNCLWWYEYIG